MIQVLGTSHNIATLDIREKFSFSTVETDTLAREVLSEGAINEIVVISTCNRSEFYIVQNSLQAEEAFQYLFEKICKVKGLPSADYKSFYHFTDEDAVRHLFSVSAGLDSMILGEDQIIGQIKEAYLHCTDMGFTDAILMRLFQKSFEAGKRVRSETEIRQGTTAVSYLAIDICKQHFEDFSDKTILVIGAGEASAMIVKRLKKLKLKNLIIANRTQEKAKNLLTDYPGKAIPLPDIQQHLPYCNAVIGASASPEVLVEKHDVAMLSRRPSNQLYIDISVPQSIDSSIEQIEGVSAFTVDDMKELAERNAEKRRESLAPAQKIVENVADEYMEWLAGRALRPVIQTITNNLQKFSLNELSDFQKINSSSTAETLEMYNSHITQKYIRLFIKNLKAMSDGGSQKNYVELVNSLFKIS